MEKGQIIMTDQGALLQEITNSFVVPKAAIKALEILNSRRPLSGLARRSPLTNDFLELNAVKRKTR